MCRVVGRSCSTSGCCILALARIAGHYTAGRTRPYSLPARRALPIEVGRTLELVLRQRRVGPGNLAQGLVILDPTISSWPVLAALEPAPYAQAFDEKDARLSPLGRSTGTHRGS